MKKTRIMAVLAAGAMLLSACGGNGANKDLSKEAMRVGKYKVTAGDIAVLTDIMGASQQSGGFKATRDQQVEQIEDMFQYASVAKKMDIKLDDDDKDRVLAVRAGFAQRMGGYEKFEKYVEENGSSIKGIDQICEASVYMQKLTEKLNKDLGDKEPSEEELKKCYKEAFYSAKHILIQTNGTGAQTDGKQGKELADELLKRAKNGENFDDLMNEYSEDPGLAQQPEGYTFTAESMLPQFSAKTKELKVGEIGMCETVAGYHIILRQELPAFETQKATVEKYYSQYLINKKFEELLKQYKIKTERKQDVINTITEGVIKKDDAATNSSDMQESVPQISY